MALLIYLIRFYDVHDYHAWKDTDVGRSRTVLESDGEPSDSERSETCEDAVRRYPESAVEALAPLIGLDEDNFHSFQAQAAEFRQRPQQPVAKRPAIANLETVKRTRKQMRATPPPRPSQMVIPLEELLASPKSKAKSSSHGLDNSCMLYGSSSRERRARQREEKIQATQQARKATSTYSGGSMEVIEQSPQSSEADSPTEEIIQRSHHKG